MMDPIASNQHAGFAMSYTTDRTVVPFSTEELSIL